MKKQKHVHVLSYSVIHFNHDPATLYVVLPITSKNHHHTFHTHFEWFKGGSAVESFILCDQIRTVSRKRFKYKMLGTVTPETLEKIDHLLRILLNI